MGEARKTKAQLLEELHELRERLAELESRFDERASIGAFGGSDEALRAALDAAADGILAVDTAGKVIFANKRFADMWRIPPDLLESGDDEELLNFVFAQLEDPDGFLAKVRELYESPRDDFDVVHFRDGRIFERFSRAWARGDVLAGRVWSFRDVTEHHRADRALRESEERYRSLFDQNPDAVCSIDLAGKFLSYNQAVMKMSGYSAQELENMSFAPLVVPEYLQEAMARVEKVLKGDPQNFDTVGIRKDGTLAHLNLTCLPIVVEGEIVGAYGIAKDNTESKRAEEQRQELESKIREAQKLESLGMLAGAIAHDFGDLLMAILGNAELALSRLSPTAPARASIQEIQQAAKSATDLTEQMLAYSGSSESDPQPVALGELMHDMAHLLESQLPGTASLELELAADVPMVSIDAAQIGRAVTSLVRNASEALGGEGGAVAVATGVTSCNREDLDGAELSGRLPEGPYVFLEVKDSGSGMDSETRAQAFDPFFTTKRGQRGLGLSAVLGIMREHGGAISLESAVGVGTTVRLLFPVLDDGKE